MSQKKCDILKTLIADHRPDLVREALEYNTDISAALLHGMLKSGFPAKDFETSNTTVINMIKVFVGVSDKGHIFGKRVKEKEHINIPSTPTTKETAKQLYECVKRKRNGEKEQGSRKMPRCKYPHSK